MERRSSLSRNLSSPAELTITIDQSAQYLSLLTELRINIDEPTIECRLNTEKDNCEHTNSNPEKLDSGHLPMDPPICPVDRCSSAAREAQVRRTACLSLRLINTSAP